MGLREDIIDQLKHANTLPASKAQAEWNSNVLRVVNGAISVHLNVRQSDVDIEECTRWSLDCSRVTGKLLPQPAQACLFWGPFFVDDGECILAVVDKDDGDMNVVNMQHIKEPDGRDRLTGTPVVRVGLDKDGHMIRRYVRNKELFPNLSEEDYQASSLYTGQTYAAILGLLSLKQARHTHVPAPHKLNKAREKKGKSPINDTVTITLHVTESVSKGGAHASPRPHWRRGHVRRLASGGVTMVSPHAVMGYAEPKNYIVKV